jgi:hypothetical protein
VLPPPFRTLIPLIVALAACSPESLDVSSTVPAEGAVLSRTLDVLFDHPLDPRTLRGVEVRRPAGLIDTELSLLDGGTRLRITLAGVPDVGEAIEVVLPETLRGLNGERGSARRLSFSASGKTPGAMTSPGFRIEGARLSR